MRDRAEDAKEDFIRSHRSFKSQIMKSKRRPRFRVTTKMSGIDVLKRASCLKLLELETLEGKFLKQVNGFPVEAIQTVKDAIGMYKNEEALHRGKDSRAVAEKIKELDRRKESLRKANEELARLRSKTKSASISSAASSSSAGRNSRQTQSTEVARPKRMQFIGTWEAVCNGDSFFVNIDADGGVISREGYSEQFKISGDGTSKNNYNIQLGVEKWELSNMQGPNKLNWIGKTSSFVSKWTRKSEVPEVSILKTKGKGLLEKQKPSRSQPKSTVKVMESARSRNRATAPPEGREATPISPSLMPRHAPFQMPTPESKQTFGMRADKSPDMAAAETHSVSDQSELLSELSEFVEPPRRVILEDPHLRGLPFSPEPALDDIPEPSKTHLEELLGSEAYADMEPFTKQGFTETAF